MDTLPHEAKAAWRNLRRESTLHPGLTFYRFMEMEDDGKFNKECLKNYPERIAIPFAEEYSKRLEEHTQWLESQGCWKTTTFCARLITRMAVGLGIPSVTENGMSLDHTLGIPVVPGSVLKGVTQDFALLHGDSGHDPAASRGQTLIDPEFVAVFGAQTPDKPDESFKARQGNVIFFDAFPEKSTSPFEVDIMNPHYGAYYGKEGGKAPADYLSPNPILFLTIKTGIVFRFALAVRSKARHVASPDGERASNEANGDQILKTVESWLKGAFRLLGVGGKTRVGYGMFEMEECP